MIKGLLLLALLAAPLIMLALVPAVSAQSQINPGCLGETTGSDRWGDFTTWARHFLDGGRLCDAEGEEHGGTSGADGVSAMDFDGDCDLDIITGWEESGKVFIYLNPTFTARPGAGCPVKSNVDNTQPDTGATVGQWPAIEVTRDGHPNSPFSGVEDAVFADNDGDRVADYVVIATELGRMKTFISFPTPVVTPEGGSTWQWHTFDARSGDEFFMRAVIGNIDNQGCPDVLVGSKTTADSGPTGDIRWWTCPASWTPQLWKAGAPLPSYGDQSEPAYFKNLWGDHHLMATNIEWIMEMNIFDLVPGANPRAGGFYNEILFTDRRKVGYMYLVDPANITANSSWRYVNIDNPDGGAADFRWYWLGQLVDNDSDGNLMLGDPGDRPEIVAAYNGNVGRGVFARWYEITGTEGITLDGQAITVPTWARYEVVVDGRVLPWGNDSSGGDPTRQNKATGIADVNGDLFPEIIATIRGSNFSGAFFLEPETGSVPPRCNVGACSDTQEWVVRRITPHYAGDIKFDNLALVDADFDCDIDVFSVEENGVGDYGLGVVWYENTLAQGLGNGACNHAPTLTAATTSVAAGEGSQVALSGNFNDVDNDTVTITPSFGAVATQPIAGTWAWTYTPQDGPDNRVLTLTASDGFGGFASLSVVVSAVNVPPAVNGVIVGPDPADVREAVTAAATFADPAGILDAPYRCTINYGDGSAEQNGIVAGSSCSFPPHSYNAPGSYNVVVTVRDDDNAAGSLTASAVVTYLPPVVNAPAISPVPSAEGSGVSVSAGFTDRGANGPYSCSVNYGDDSGALAGSASGSVCHGPAHSYGDNGTYQITVAVTDRDGVSGTANRTHQVTNVAPAVNAVVINPQPADVGAAVTAVASFADPAGAHDAPYRCAVDYGDGSGAQDGIATGDRCSGPAHAYRAAGNYTVTMTVRDKDGGVGSRTATAVVTNLPPVVSAPAVSPAPSAEGTAVTAIAGFSDGGVNGPYTCSVNYGDGSGALAGAVSGNVCNGPTHSYDDNGAYQVTVVVRDRDGLSGSANQTHQVTNVAPMAVFAVAPAEIFVGESVTASFSNTLDPSAADSLAGFTYSYDCRADGTWDKSGLSLGSFVCAFTTSGSLTVAGQVRDKDGGQTGYTAAVTVLSAQQAMQTVIADVNALLAAGVINTGQAASMIEKLQNASASLNGGNSTAAVNLILALANQVEGLTNGGILNDAQSHLLLDKARRVIDAVHVVS